MKNKYPAERITLVALLALRCFSHFESIFSNQIGELSLFALYAAASIGVIIRKKWGSALSALMGALDLAISIFIVEGVTRIFIVAFDFLLIFLSVRDFRSNSKASEMIAVPESTGTGKVEIDLKQGETMAEKKSEQKLTIIGLILYGLIMLSLILMYKDFLISITAVVIMLVLVVQYTAPIIRERKLNKRN